MIHEIINDAVVEDYRLFCLINILPQWVFPCLIILQGFAKYMHRTLIVFVHIAVNITLMNVIDRFKLKHESCSCLPFINNRLQFFLCYTWKRLCDNAISVALNDFCFSFKFFKQINKEDLTCHRNKRSSIRIIELAVWICHCSEY